MMEKIGSNRDSRHVVILGGGPAGTACALALCRLAPQMGKRVRITLLESKKFAHEGHYNQCVGVLSPPLPRLLDEELGVPFPHHLVRAEITGYTLHSAGAGISLEDEEEPSIALRRVLYDAYMLDVARERGVTVLPARAIDLEFRASSVVVYTESAPVEGDVVVGAFGLDEGSASLFARLTPYRPPPALSSVVTKYHPGDEAMDTFGTHIHAFLPRHPRIEFGGVTPKGNHLTINIAGRAVDASLMEVFLAQSDVRAVLPNFELAGTYDPDDLRFFKGRFPYSRARHYYGNRYVMVGDAAGLVRSFKGKGVTSAVLTGLRAAKTILQAGVSKAAFHDHYRPANEDLTSDLPYGRLMRVLTILLARYGVMDAVLRGATTEPALQAALLGAVSGHTPYRQVLTGALSPSPVSAVLGAMLRRRSQDRVMRSDGSEESPGQD
ncbi:MAG: NAD(P)/FAD-dependent oxidoreductase [Thermoanaerobaculia bacterium]